MPRDLFADTASGPRDLLADQPPKPKKSTVPTPTDFPRVSPGVQKDRDFTRYGLLRSEEAATTADPNLRRELDDMNQRYPDFDARYKTTSAVTKAAAPPKPKIPAPETAGTTPPVPTAPQASPTSAPPKTGGLEPPSGVSGWAAKQLVDLYQKGSPLSYILEPLLSMGTAGTSGMVGGAMSALLDKQKGEKREDAFARGMEALTYHPHTERGRAGMEGVSNFVDKAKIPAAMPELAGMRSPIPKNEKWERPPTEREATIADLMDKGYTIPSMEGRPSMLNNILQGLAGKVQTERRSSMKNVDVVKRDAARALELPPETELTMAKLNELRSGPWRAPYIALDGMPRIVLDGQFVDSPLIKGIQEVKNPIRAPGPMGNYQRVQSRYITGKDAAEGLQSLRMEARGFQEKFKKTGDPADRKLAKEYSDAAANLESQVDRYLDQHGHAELMDDLRHSRKLFARSYQVEKALNDATGEVSPGKIAAQDTREGVVQGPLKNISDISKLSQRATQSESKVGATPDVSPLGAGAAMMANNPTRALDYLLLRPLLTRLITSPTYQDKFVRPDLGQKMPISRGAPYAEMEGSLGAVMAAMQDKERRKKAGQ